MRLPPHLILGVALFLHGPIAALGAPAHAQGRSQDQLQGPTDPELEGVPSAPVPKPAPPPAPPPPQGAWITDPATRCRVWNPTPDGKEAIKWEGACPAGTAQGTGVLQWFLDEQPTDRFEGELKNGRPDGPGVWIAANGDRYEGAFRSGQADGQGSWRYANGDAYVGEMKNGDYNGRGIVTYANGDRYEGTFKDGEYEGPGTAIYNNGGLRLDGTFHKGNLIALTLATLGDGSRYQGQFPFGRGVLTKPDGTRYEGWFNDLRLNRRGVALYPNGDRYEGPFRDGEEHGQGILKLPNGGIYEGDFFRGKPEGMGTLKEADGKILAGAWHDGCWDDGVERRALRTTPQACGFK